jgi:hypothetical protein
MSAHQGEFQEFLLVKAEVLQKESVECRSHRKISGCPDYRYYILGISWLPFLALEKHYN